MPKATPGIPYVVVPGDTLSGIAKQAYGNGRRWPEIHAANKSTLISDDPNLIFPGEVITIPAMQPLVVDVQEDSELLPNADPNMAQLVIAGTPVNVQSSSCVRSFNSGADGWAARVYWDPNDPDLVELYRPYKWKEAKYYIGGQLLCTGPLYITETHRTKEGQWAILKGFSKTKDLVDSAVDPPYMVRGATLSQRANEYCSPRGITVIDDTPTLGIFKRITAEPTEKIYTHLVKLAKQKAVLIGSTPKGELLISLPKTQFENYGSIGDDLAFGSDYHIVFDGTKRYSVYRVNGKRRGRSIASNLANDTVVPKSRTLTVNVGDISDQGELQKAAEWERSKGLSESLSFPFPVSGWYAPNGKLWRENNYVTVKSPAMFISDGFTFLIKSVEYLFEPDGRKCILNLVPPTAFGTEELVEPWL